MNSTIKRTSKFVEKLSDRMKQKNEERSSQEEDYEIHEKN